MSNSVEIVLNGKPMQVPHDISVALLIEQLGFKGKRVAVEINLDIVPKSLHEQTRLASGDRIELVHAIGGG